MMCDNNNLNVMIKGCKNTRTRQAILNVLHKADLPITAEEIYICIKEHGGNISVSTVYRNLELILQKGMAIKLDDGSGKYKYQLKDGRHNHHITCTNCHKMISIDICPIKALEADVVEETRFEITGHNLELFGICPQCRKK